MIYLGADRHGFTAIGFVEGFLARTGVAFENLGVRVEGEDTLLQLLIPSVVTEVLKDKKNLAILSCGTGVGVEVGANKFAGIRACLATNEMIAKYSRVYDDCNILCLAGWETDKEVVEKIVGAWLRAEYDGNEKRRRMFEDFDTWH